MKSKITTVINVVYVRIIVAILCSFLLLFFTQNPDSRQERLVAPDGTVNWNRYYTNSETNEVLREFTRLYPNFTKLYTIGKSYLGVDLMLLEITNHEYKSPDEKPAMYLDGGIHAGELTGSAVALYTAGYLLKNYGKDLWLQKR